MKTVLIPKILYGPKLQMNNKYLNAVLPNIDSYGVIGNDNGDEGDSCNREGTFAVLVRELYDQDKINIADYLLLRERYWKAFTSLKCGKGGLRRGPNQSEWFGQDCIMSRDQWTPNPIACGAMDLNDHLNYLLKGHLLHRGLMFTTNVCKNGVWRTKDNWKLPDLTVLSSWGYYIRAYRAWWLWPLLNVFDLELPINSMIIVHHSYYKPKDTDVINHLNTLIQAKRRLPTPFSWLARQLLKLDKRGMQFCMDEYFSRSLNAPAMNVLYRDLLPEFLK